MKQKLPVGLIGWTFLVGVASFISWGTFQAKTTSINAGPFGDLDPFMGMPMSITLTGWQGHLTLAGTALPNWLVIMAALAAAILAYIRSAGLGDVNRAVCIALLVYGIAHVILLIVVITANRGVIGFGALLTIA